MPSSDGYFKKGNPGRKPGSRNRLSESFLKALADDFERFGPETIIAVREERPSDYLKIVASLLPKQARLQVETEVTLVDVLVSLSETQLKVGQQEYLEGNSTPDSVYADVTDIKLIAAKEIDDSTS